jgi:DNA-binding response OmpR family regulator
MEQAMNHGLQQTSWIDTVPQSHALVIGPLAGGALEAIRAIFKRRGHSVEFAPADMAAIADLGKLDLFDLLILELDIQDVKAVQLCAQLRRVTLAPLLVIVPEIGRSQGIQALELGADSFVVAPFDRRELIVRSEALIRRYRCMFVAIAADPSVSGSRPAAWR